MTPDESTATTTAEPNNSTDPDDFAADLPVTMDAVVGRSYGDESVLEVQELPVPEPARGELLVEVRGSSLNALDWHFVTGTPYIIRPTSGLRRPRRLVPGADVAGTVVATGAGVSRFAVGDEVFGECKGGGCSRYLTVVEDSVVAKPSGVSFEAAGATAVAGLTALQALRTHAKVQPGESVLINGSAGGVGTFAVQIAGALGASVTAVCSGRNVEMVRALGADEVLDYTSTDFVEAGERFDVMVDNVGNRTPSECTSVLRPSGRYVGVSGPKENRWLGPVPHLARMAFALWRTDRSFHQFTAEPDLDDLRYLGELLESGTIVPEIDRTVGLDGVAEAMAEIGGGHARSKIAVDPSRVAT